MRQRILVIDDNTAFRGALGQVLDTERFTVIAEAATGASGVQLAREHEPDLVIVDVQLPDTDGFDVAEQLAALDLPMEVILTSGLDSSDLGSAGCRQLGARLHPEGRALRPRGRCAAA